MYIKNKQDQCNIKAYSPFHFSCKLKHLCFGIAYFSNTQRVACKNKLTKLLKNEKVIKEIH